MSPDEGIADEEVSAYITAEDTGRDCWDRRLRVRHGLAVFMANRIRAHRASGEGGSPSALRASAPEGNATVEYARMAEARMEAAEDRAERLRAALTQHAVRQVESETGPATACWLCSRDERTPIGTPTHHEPGCLLASPPQADAKANLARAAHSLAPEGFSDGERALACNAVLDRANGTWRLDISDVLAADLACVALEAVRATATPEDQDERAGEAAADEMIAEAGGIANLLTKGASLRADMAEKERDAAIARAEAASSLVERMRSCLMAFVHLNREGYGSVNTTLAAEALIRESKPA